ncbi:MAG: hypothetical protein B0W54_20845 [Cellvibrio sp. 79]|nr:MAG: hypothetical protein B0W54_20845 [Cellvibrio sp. 79]
MSILDSTIEAENADVSLAALGAGEILLGRLESIDEAGNAVISVPHMPLFQQCVAMTTIAVLPQHIGRQVALMFTQGVEPKPIIIGLIYSPLQQVLDSVIANTCDNSEIDEVVFAESVGTNIEGNRGGTSENSIYMDGKQLIMEGHEEVVLRCGEASITLSRNGKISIRGKYLLSRASGVNRILGGSVQVN